jgi:hypothetical protein
MSDEKVDKEYEAIFIENEYIKVMILPELGGRVQMAYDKIRERHFIYYNHGFNTKNTDYPHFSKSKDKAFRLACQEILDNPLYMMQWVEEADRGDKLIPLDKGYKAFCYYHLPDGKVASLWKHALTSISEDDLSILRSVNFYT